MTTKRALVILHSHLAIPGLVGEALTARGYRVETFLVVPPGHLHDENPDLPVTFPDFAAYDVIVPMGSPWSVNLRNGWITEEIALVRAAHDGGRRVLGICYGAQVLAVALGGTVGPAPRRELGWTRIDTDAPHLVPPGPWFQFHHDRWTLPEGVRELARSDVASQAFTSARTLGVQFHPELTTTDARAWLDAATGDTAPREGQEPARPAGETAGADEGARRRVAVLMDGFLGLRPVGSPAGRAPRGRRC